MILCKETSSKHKNPVKAILSAHVSRAGNRSVKMLPALPSTSVLQHATAQLRYCKQEQVYYIEISCRSVIWADYAFPLSMSGNWAECTLATYTLQVSGVTTAFKCRSESRKLSFHVCTEQDSLPNLQRGNHSNAVITIATLWENGGPQISWFCVSCCWQNKH